MRILVGDARKQLLDLPDASVQSVICSPPYFGLRDYETANWIGGDAECDHVVGEYRKGAGEGMAILGAQHRGGGVKAGQIPKKTARHTCPKCGAKRLDHQIGLEPTPTRYVRDLVLLFREVRRVLRPDGTLWLNLGDSYAATGGLGIGTGENGIRRGRSHQQRAVRPGGYSKSKRGVDRYGGGNAYGGANLKAKDLIGIPWRVALALQKDGWWLRQDIIWHKPNPMPESILDRFTKAHEYVFLFSKSGRPTIWRSRDTKVWCSSPDKSERVPNPSKNPKAVTRKPMVNRWVGFDYYFDQHAVSEPVAGDTLDRYERGRSEDHKYVDGGPGGQTLARSFEHMRQPVPAGWDEGEGRHGTIHRTGRRRGNSKTFRGGGAYVDHRSEANGAEVPRESTGLEPNEGGRRNRRSVWTVATSPFRGPHFATYPPALVEPCILASCPVGGVVLDPFGGAGTTSLVAERLARDSIMIELNPATATMALMRIKSDRPTATVTGATEPDRNDNLPLWSNGK